MTPEEPDRPLGPRTTGGQDAAILSATRVGTVIFGLAIQSLLAYTLLSEGRGSFTLCVVFASVLGVLFTPGAREGAQYFVVTRQATGSSSPFPFPMAWKASNRVKWSRFMGQDSGRNKVYPVVDHVARVLFITS